MNFIIVDGKVMDIEHIEKIVEQDWYMMLSVLKTAIMIIMLKVVLLGLETTLVSQKFF